MVRFGLHFGLLWDAIWATKSVQNRSKNLSTINLRQHTPKRALQEASRPPQEAPGPPKEASRSPQEGAQTAPNPPIWPQETSFSPNRIFPIFYLCSRSSICLHLRKDSTKLSRSYQEAPKSFANQHIIISELPSLQVSELPVSSCLGGIREAQTIYEFCF